MLCVYRWNSIEFVSSLPISKNLLGFCVLFNFNSFCWSILQQSEIHENWTNSSQSNCSMIFCTKVTSSKCSSGLQFEEQWIRQKKTTKKSFAMEFAEMSKRWRIGCRRCFQESSTLTQSLEPLKTLIESPSLKK